MLLDARESLLLIIDMQEKLAPAVQQIDAVTEKALALLAAAAHLSVPVLATEHCRDKIGVTIEPVRERLADSSVLAKRFFSAQAEEEFADRLAQFQRKQIVVVGLETHVCVLQTTHDLQHAGYACYLVETPPARVNRRTNGQQ